MNQFRQSDQSHHQRIQRDKPDSSFQLGKFLSHPRELENIPAENQGHCDHIEY